MRIEACVVLSALVALLSGGCARETGKSPDDAARDGGRATAASAGVDTSETRDAVTTTGISPWAPPMTTAPAPPVPVIDPLGKPAAGSASNGAALYAAKCASCHGTEARADTAMAKKYGLLDFRSANVRALSSSDLSQIMSAGRGTISAEAHPAAKLTESDARDMVAFIRSLS